MEIILLILFALMVPAYYVGYKRLSNRMSRLGGASATPTLALAAPANKHQLDKLYFDNDTSDYATDGWHWKCKCGAKASVASRFSDGSEEAAMAAWKRHAKLHEDVNLTDSWEAKYKELEKKHNDYVEACICKNL